METWTARKQLLGIGDPDTLKTRFTMGEVLLKQNAQSEALTIFEEVATQAQKSLDPSSSLRAYILKYYEKLSEK